MSAGPLLGGTVAGALAEALAEAGVRRVFGVPGGGSSLDVIAACAGRGIDFVLTAGETAAAIMAAVTGELTGIPGVALTALGPGLLSAANGLAYARLERAPMLLISDCFEAEGAGGSTHQQVDHQALVTPIAKASVRLEAGAAAADVAALLAQAVAEPRGPVHIDLSPSAAISPAGAGRANSSDADTLPLPDPADIAAARQLLAGARRPVLIAGTEARAPEAAAALRRWAAALGCPVLTSYKAKGVVPDDDPLAVGHFTGAAAEAPCLEAADLIVLCGLDPVEPIPGPWRYAAPVLELAGVPRSAGYAPVAARITGPLHAAMAELYGANRDSDWRREEIAALRGSMRARLASPASEGIAPQALVEAARRAAPEGARVAIDAGAHMVPAFAFWTAREANGVIKSNGLSTMGFALPAAIASALAEPGRPALALTGDGGLMMGLGELATAARLGLPVRVVVFNDAALSLIDVKQQGRGLAPEGVRYKRPDFAGMARAFGWQAASVGEPGALDAALAEAMAAPGPALLDVAVDPAGYPAQLAALRG